MRQEAFTLGQLIDICENSLLVTGAEAMKILKCGRTKFEEKVQPHLTYYQPPGEQRRYYLISVLKYMNKHSYLSPIEQAEKHAQDIQNQIGVGSKVNGSFIVEALNREIRKKERRAA